MPLNDKHNSTENDAYDAQPAFERYSGAQKRQRSPGFLRKRHYQQVIKETDRSVKDKKVEEPIAPSTPQTPRF